MDDFSKALDIVESKELGPYDYSWVFDFLGLRIGIILVKWNEILNYMNGDWIYRLESAYIMVLQVFLDITCESLLIFMFVICVYSFKRCNEGDFAGKR